MKETIIRTAADLEKAFAPVPSAYVEMQRHFEFIAEELNKIKTPEWLSSLVEGFEIVATVEAPSKLPNGDWCAPGLLINGNRYYNLDVRAEYSRGSSWRRSSTGRVRIAVGPFGARQSYPQKAAGSFSYDKIADKIASELFDITRREAMVRAQERAAKSNADAVARLNEQFNLKTYGEFTVASSGKPGTLILRMGYNGSSKSGTPEQLAVVLEALRAVGWI